MWVTYIPFPISKKEKIRLFFIPAGLIYEKKGVKIIFVERNEKRSSTKSCKVIWERGGNGCLRKTLVL